MEYHIGVCPDSRHVSGIFCSNLALYQLRIMEGSNKVAIGGILSDLVDLGSVSAFESSVVRLQVLYLLCSAV